MNRIKILYVDSDIVYGQKFLLKLLEENYDVKYISTFKDALIDFSFHSPDIIITDTNLNDGSGINLIKKIKKQNSNIKSIIISNESNKDILINAIEIKVDDYIFKDTALNEIINKVRKIKIISKNIKIEKKEKEENINFDLGEHHVYNGHNIISEKNRIIKLTPQENKLLKILLEAKGTCVPYEVIQNTISKNYTSLDTIRTVIRKIRKKSFHNIIQNQSGIGYRVFWSEKNPQEIMFDNEYILIEAKVLIVKGNNKKNELLSYKLQTLGFKCESAFTLQQAKDSVDTTKYDYIIVDLNLPDGEGIDLIRKFDELHSTKIIVLSTGEDIHYKDYLYFKGILDYIIDIEDEDILSSAIYRTIHRVEYNTRFNNILIIEKSKKTCEQIKDLLLPRNYNVDFINTLSQGFELMKSKPYSLVVIDIDFGDCFKFIQSIKKNISKAINFIVLSEINRTYSTVREAYKNGASECLRKPIFAEEFILKVDQHTDSTKLIFELSDNKKILTNYKKIVDQSAVISKTNVSGIITYVNSVFCSLSGYSKKELIGKPHNIIRHPDSSSEMFENMWHTIKYKKEIWTGVIKNRAKDGHTYYVQTSIMPILDNDGEVEEFIALRNDITNIYKGS